MHLICPPKFLHNLCFSFLLGITAVPREIENNACAIFFLGGGGGGQIRCIMGDMRVAYSAIRLIGTVLPVLRCDWKAQLPLITCGQTICAQRRTSNWTRLRFLKLLVAINNFNNGRTNGYLTYTDLYFLIAYLLRLTQFCCLFFQVKQILEDLLSRRFDYIKELY